MDQLQLGLVDAAMLLGRVAIVEEPDRGPAEAEDAKVRKGMRQP